jgi:ABC-type cobalamin/Fe3+-siderophores transport system ATPase subunit
MRLRFFHLPHLPPLEKLSLVLGQEPLLYGQSADRPEGRRGAINFVVGLNGTGKSTVLRALYQTFHRLKAGQPAPFPVTVAWELAELGSERVFIYHQPAEGAPVFIGLNPPREGARPAEWLKFLPLIEHLKKYGEEPFVRGPDVPASAALQKHLPRLVMACTSGAEDLWDWIEHRPLAPDPEREGQGTPHDDRPPGWSLEREWEEERPVRVANMLTRFASRERQRTELSGGSTEMPALSGGPLGVLSPEDAARLGQELAPMAALSRKVEANQMLRSERPPEPCFRVRADEIGLAAIALAVWQAATELRGHHEQRKLRALRRTFQKQLHDKQPGEGARRVLNQLDWFQPTHLSLVYRDADDRVTREQREELLCLCALADEVVEQPLGRQRAIISLAATDPADESGDIAKRLTDEMTLGLPSERVERLARRMSGCASGAESVLRLFSEAKEMDTALAELFRGLRKWRECGLLESWTLTIQRLGPLPDEDRETDPPEPDVIAFDQLSDGERMLLGRTALLFLLRGQDDSLLLLDEPETHFNDAWKREIVDIVDDNLLKQTAAQVVVSTHTSIALTDVFKAEIVLLKRDRDTGALYEAEEPVETFGASPEDILREIFGAEETIGRRAAQFLDLVLVVSAHPEAAAALWETGDFSGPAMETLAQAVSRLPYSFENTAHLGRILRTVWAYTRTRLDGRTPHVGDTLRAIEEKLGPGHYQYEFRRRMSAPLHRENVAPH